MKLRILALILLLLAMTIAVTFAQGAFEHPLIVAEATAEATETGNTLRLYLCSDSNSSYILDEQCPIGNGYTQVFLYAGLTPEFVYPLDGDITGGDYVTNLVLASASTTTVKITLLFSHNGVETPLDSTDVSVSSTRAEPFSSDFHSDDPATQPGDKLILRVEATKGDDAAIFFADSSADTSWIEIPLIGEAGTAALATEAPASTSAPLTGTSTEAAAATSTPDPITKTMEDADQLYRSGDIAGAISQYGSILQQSTDTAIRVTVFAQLKDIGKHNLQQADLQWKQRGGHEDGIKACETYESAYSAYALILQAKDRPTFEQDQFYTDAVQVDVALIICYIAYVEPGKSYAEVIQFLLDDVALYPDNPAILDILVPAILSTFENEVRYDYADKLPEVLNDGQLISAAVGEYQVNDKKMSDWVDATLLASDLCSGNPIRSTIVGTSTTKKVFSCELQIGSWLSDAIDQAGLASVDPSEIWFVLGYESIEVGTGRLECTGYRTDTNTNFSYSYRGQWQDVYSIRDVHSGSVVASQTFLSTAPRCVFNTCSVNTLNNTATCNGGESSGTYDEAVVIQWLKDNVK